MRYDARQETFEEIVVLGIPALFHDMRINRESVPKGMYLYEVRHDDEGWGLPVQISKGIMVNHYGSIITSEPLELPLNGYLDIDPKNDWKYGQGEHLTVEEFRNKYTHETE